MRKKSNAEARESTLASGWVVEGDESSTPSDAPAEPQTDEAVPAGDPAVEVGGEPAVGAEGEPAVGAEGEPAVGAEGEPDPDGGPEQASNAVLVLLGVFGGLYALYTWGWFVVAKAYADFNTTVAAGSGSFGQVLQQILFWAAPFATVLWFLSAVLFLRRRALWLGIALVLGAVILVPLPMLVVSAQ